MATEGMTETSRTSSALLVARDVGVVLDSEADATERLGTLSPRSVDALKESELFWILVPTELGGQGLDVVTLMGVVEELSRADGSSGWSFMANASSTAIFAAYCGDEAVDAMFVGSSRPIVAGMLGPGGNCEETSGGYVGSGRYSFASGGGHADWFGGGMFVLENGKPRKLATGAPEQRVCLVPRERVELLANWDVMGLVGTGSYDYRIAEQFIGSDFTFERTTLAPQRGGPTFSLGVVGVACAGHTGVALGIMARALNEIAALALRKKRPASPTFVGDSELFRQDFAYNEAAYQAARRFAFEVYADAQATVFAGEALTEVQRQRFRQSATFIHKVAADVVRFCYTWGGSDALRNPSRLGRCMRDMSAATQHIFVDPATMVGAAPALITNWAEDRRFPAR
ncbi:MAG TPA: acyl-CoA dehydrogenase family protein [Nitrolancea sp.]|nr:acyl-CoA dehydrogenase family protein [Nitrolancea sp.]